VLAGVLGAQYGETSPIRSKTLRPSSAAEAIAGGTGMPLELALLEVEARGRGRLIDTAQHPAATLRTPLVGRTRSVGCSPRRFIAGGIRDWAMPGSSATG
jgi:hypothetical protein